MLDDLDAIIERLIARTLTDKDIQLLYQLLQQLSSQGIVQLGKFNMAIREARDFQVGDRYTGATSEEICLIVRKLVQELNALQSPHSNSSVNTHQNNDHSTGNLPLRKLVLDPTTLDIINIKLEVIEEICRAGYLPETQQQALRQLKQHLQDFSDLNQNLQNIAEEGDRLIQEAVAAMRLQLDALRLSGKKLTEETRAGLSPTEQVCQQVETMIFQTFVNRIEDSRLGADWIGANLESLVKYGSNKVLSHFPDLNASEKAINDFRFSLKQFLEQVSFCLFWVDFSILDSPGIPLIFQSEQYEVAFQSMKECIPNRLHAEVIHEIESCFNYLIERLQHD